MSLRLTMVAFVPIKCGKGQIDPGILFNRKDFRVSRVQSCSCLEVSESVFALFLTVKTLFCDQFAEHEVEKRLHALVLPSNTDF